MKRDRVAVVLMLDKAVYKEIEEEAKNRGMEIPELLEAIVEEWVEREVEEEELEDRLYSLLDQLNRKLDRLLSFGDEDF